MKRDEPAKSLGAPDAGQGDFWALVHVRLSTPIPSADNSNARQVDGYYRNLGIRSAPQRVQVHVAEAVDDGSVDWDDSEWNLVDPSALDSTIRSRIQPLASEGVWYASGRIFYSDSDEDNAPSQDSSDSANEDRRR